MKSKFEVLLEMEALFDLERIENLAVPEKFKLVDYIGLVYQEAIFAKQVGLLKVDQSPRRGINKTLTLYLMLLSKGTKFSMLKRIIHNYTRNFDQSDVYYAQTVIMGMGVMMIDQEFDSKAIYNYLMHLLGRDFLVKNQKYDGLVKITKDTKIDISTEIDYRPFEGSMRKVKYDILAVMKYNYEHDLAATKELLSKKRENDVFNFYLNMLDVSCPTLRKRIFDTYDLQESRMQRLLLNGAYELINKTDLFTAHYLFNSIIGKYSRYEKDNKEVENECDSNLAAMLEG